ncbi:hypothetical protein [Peristeroidobacter soli]|uniref:hypothetical protein n=1 Tax=Peristeroidobacter soli TaxID=2497877 RepID=UPI00101CBD80|nr:hypothetical protein [Peristeroidobacter soli]
MADGKVLEQTSVDVPDCGSDSLARPVFVGTAVAGTMDILAAIIVWALRDVPAMRVLQSIASGLLGTYAFSGDVVTAWFGVLLHYMIMSMIALVFVLASRRLEFLIRHFLVAGAAYGIVVFVVMTYVVVPLSASPIQSPPPAQVLEGLLIHMVCVGLPISLTAHRFGRRLLAN